MKKLITSLFITTMLVNVTACGTILYPERRNQKSGRIDPAVAIMDGIGLLFFVVPGLIAYAVDFATGTIYLPGGHSKLEDGHVGKMTAIKVDGPMTPEAIHKVVAGQLGEEVASSETHSYKLDAQGRKVWLN